jgi:hypothetical protein
VCVVFHWKNKQNKRRGNKKKRPVRRVCVPVFERPLIVVATSLAHQKVRAGDMTTATTNGQVAATLGFSCLWPLLSVCSRRCLLIIKGRSHRSPLMWLLSFLGKKLECPNVKREGKWIRCEWRRIFNRIGTDRRRLFSIGFAANETESLV